MESLTLEQQLAIEQLTRTISTIDRQTLEAAVIDAYTTALTSQNIARDLMKAKLLTDLPDICQP